MDGVRNGVQQVGVLLGFVELITFVLALSYFFNKFWVGFSSLLMDEGFSYLGVAIIVEIFLLGASLKQGGFVFGISRVRFLVGVYFIVLSLLFYFLGIVYSDFIVQFHGLSIILLFLSLFITLFSPVHTIDVLPLMGLFLLVPAPAGWFDFLTPWLSRLIGRFVAWITGSAFSSGAGFARIIVDSPEGPVSLEIARACTGIVTMSSVIAVIPVVLYLLSYSPRSNSRKLVAAVTALSLGLIIGFLGNIIRVLLIVLGTKYWGIERGLGLFHYSPSIIYAGLAVIASFWVAGKIGGLDLSLPKLRVNGTATNINGVALGLVLSLILSGVFIGVVEAATHIGAGEQVIGVRVASIEEFLDNPLEQLTTQSNISILSNVYDKKLTSILNALVVYRVTIETQDGLYNGFVEVVDTPSRLHTWQLCLQLQGYKILDSYIEKINGTYINVITAERNGREYVLVHRLVLLRVFAGDEAVDLYLRISLISPYNDEIIKDMSAVLINLSEEELNNADPGTLMVKYLSWLSLALLIVVLLTPLSALITNGGLVRRRWMRTLSGRR